MRYLKLINCTEDSLPKWIKDADVKNAIIELDENGSVIWIKGIWKSGTWESGIWEYGLWESGVWESGLWKSGTWESGIWESGLWESGVWESGLWKSGIWKSGLWKSGTWEDGTWKAGTWESGTWKSGERVPMCRWEVFSVGLKSIRIGCEVKTIEEWDSFFDGEEVLHTPRNTEEFKLIRANYEAVKAFLIWSK